MKRFGLDLTIVTVSATLLTGAVQDLGTHPSPAVPDQSPAAKHVAGVRLSATEKKREKGVLVVYSLQAEGFPHEKKYSLARTSMGGQTVEVSKDLRLDESGRVVKADGGGIDLGLGMMFAGESVVFTLASDDGAAKAAVEITPFPLQAQGGSGCRLTLRPMSIKGDRFQVIGEGFMAEQRVTAAGSAAGEVASVPLEPSADGRLIAVVSPRVAGQSGGEATLTASDGSCSVTVGYSWGDAMVKRPSSSTQSAASIIRSVEQAAPPGHMPEAPKGFHWAQATLIRGWFLVPDGWFFREERKPTVIGYFISREDSRLGKFQVGLTVNAKRAKEGDVVANARQIIETLSKAPNFKLLSAPKAVDTKLISGARCRVEIGEGQNAVIVDQMQLGNSRTNAMYSIGFEAPKAEWDEAWRVGQQLMASFGLSDEF